MAGGIEKKLAKIKATSLGFENHGILTFTLHLDYGGSGQGAGGIALGGEYTDKYIRGVLSACGVDEWEELPGRTVYAYAAHNKVHALEPLPTEPGKRFAIDSDFDGWSKAS